MPNEHLRPHPAEDSPPSSAESHGRYGSRIRLASRSPHPYLRRGNHKTFSKEAATPPPGTPNHEAFTTGKETEEGVEGRDFRKPKSSSQLIFSPSESGTEADDEGYSYIKALPAPPLKPRKGLRDSRGAGVNGIFSPPLTPSVIEEDSHRFTMDSTSSSKKSDKIRSSTDEEIRIARAKFLKRRRAELIRRASEVALLAVLGVLTIREKHVWEALREWHRAELLAHILIVTLLFLLYPVRLIAYAWKRTAPRIQFWRSIRVPATFDPAPLLYPVFLPVLVALSLLATFPKVTLPNIVLGLSAFPPQLIPGMCNSTYCTTHWFISLIPLIVSEHTDIPSKVRAAKPYMLKSPPPEGPQPEIIACLFALHQSLLPILHHLTTTSLLPAELHLLSISLINVLLFSEAPQAIILSCILWVGGLGLIVLTAPVLRWAVALARVPRWRMRRAGRVIQARQSFISSLNQALTRSRSLSQRAVQSDGDDDEEDDHAEVEKPSLSLETLKEELMGSLKPNFFPSTNPETMSAVDSTPKTSFSKANNVATNTRRRRYTLPTVPATNTASRDAPKQRTSRSRPSLGQAFLSFTPRQANLRKWVYAIYVYIVMALLIFGPIRSLILRYALNGHEPFGWAIGYLFGNIRDVRFQIVNWNLENWIPFPSLDKDADVLSVHSYRGRAETWRLAVYGEANTRLGIAAYCLVVLAVGMTIVLRLSAVVEVDTRRKVFHGMMVAMLLPTTFIDPTFIALALGLILSIFLILDLLRASQLPPLSKPLAYFLTPYVDGRDLRGPVVVSHIFLLIGCAVPLWLSLAGMPTSGNEPWANWEIPTRDVSMISGVVCVGMGDAAASLIGRRYGRRKWPWSGGKSLEGSAAFAIAVTVGLTAGKIWLWLGEWEESDGKSCSLVGTVVKAAVSGCAASFMEAVLTGGNDNVVVPVALWVVVRAVSV
ncbi:hypothetical protein EJ08DRAFT_626316 [Tothia fuscella]|uniref:dolichol kinase n=1 Tax=Tothia fuscella TaxID=1048955 RepID=A0A9P4P0I6_9PEZI|nr:hypothetical protein EJ08DRAFT_626316 [Tothia fuscella]